MLSEQRTSSEQPRYLKGIMKSAGKWYKTTKTAYPRLCSGLSMVEPLINPMASALTKYAEPLMSSFDSHMSHLILTGAQGLETAEITFTEKKDLYKAAMKAWLQDHKNYSDYLDSVKKFYSFQWRTYFEEHIHKFYTKSLQYQNPQKMLKLAADMLSEGSDIFRGNLILAWKNVEKFSCAEYLANLKEMMGDGWTERFQENARIFVSISKLQNRSRGLVENWKETAREAAETTSLIIFAGADELYFWSRDTFNASYPVIYEKIVMMVPFKVYLNAVKKYFEEIDVEKIKAITWPEDLKGKVTPLLSVFRVEAWATKHWEMLDKDEDGKVTFGDLVLVVQKAKQDTIEKTQMIWGKVTNFSLYNGDVSEPVGK